MCIGRGRPLPTITWAKVSNEGLLPIENKAFHEGNIGQQYVQSSLMLLNVSEHENGSVFVCTGSSNISMYNITGSRNITGLIANDVSTIQLIVQGMLTTCIQIMYFLYFCFFHFSGTNSQSYWTR